MTNQLTLMFDFTLTYVLLSALWKMTILGVVAQKMTYFLISNSVFTTESEKVS